MPFDIDSARKAGYKDSEIADFLSKQHPNFDVKGAMKAGYSVDEIAYKTNKPSPTISNASVIAKGAMNSVPGISPALDLTSHFAKLSPEAQKAALTAAGAEIGLPAGPVASGAVAATMGGLSEASNNPSTAAKVLSPIVKTALAPTAQSVQDTMNQITSPEAKDFMKRRAVEAGTAAASGAILKGVRGVETEGPISAGIENPKVVFGATRKKILEELGLAKNSAMRGENLAEGQRLMRMLRSPAGQGKLADEAIKAVEDGTKLSNTQLLAYEEALGKVQTKGGTFSHVYKSTRDVIKSQLKEQAPTLAAKKAAARKVFQSEGAGETPSLITAITHPIASATHLPGAQRVMGAATRIGAETLMPGFVASSDLLSSTLQNLANKRRKAKGQ